MKKFMIAYKSNGGEQGWITVRAENEQDALDYFYTCDIDGRSVFVFVAEVLDIPEVEG